MLFCPRLPALLLALALATAAHAQKPPPLPDAPSAQQTQQQKDDAKAAEHAEGDREVHNQEQQRLLVVVPNFNTVISGQGVRLTPGQKTRLAVHATLDPFNVVGAFFIAGISEVEHTERGYHYGPEGYFKRVGANYLDVVDGTMLAGAVYPILLHQDPRFFRQGTGTIGSRVRHALLAAVIARGDNGHRQFNFSNVLGNYTAGALSNLYYPADTRGPGLAFEGGTIVTAEGSLGNLGLEFAPDVSAWLRNRRHHPNSGITP